MTHIIATGAVEAALRQGLAQLDEAPVGLTVWAAPILDDPSPVEAMDSLFHAPLRLVEKLAGLAPEVSTDRTGESTAGAQILLLVDRRFLVTGSGSAAQRAAVAALQAWLEDAALRYAPALRINLLALSLEDPPSLAPSLRWICTRAIVTGQVLRLGQQLPSPAPFTTDPAAKHG